MGLDVDVYTNVKKADINDFNFRAFVIRDDWSHKIKNLEKDAFYKGDRVSGLVSYPYSFHNRFRKELFKMVIKNEGFHKVGHWLNVESGSFFPFCELLDFADNDGCLDWSICEELHEQFEDWLQRANEFLSSDYLKVYIEWLEVFALAKDKGGVVVFT